MQSPLHHKSQIVPLILLAREAHALAAGRGDGRDFDEWRHDEVERVTGRRGLTLCDQSHYDALKRHFLDLKGNVVGAFKWAKKEAQGNDVRQALWHLKALLGKRGLPLGYAEELCHHYYHHTIAELKEAKHVWALHHEFQRRFKSQAHRRIVQKTSRSQLSEAHDQAMATFR